jgi:hypothetical protein
LENDLQPCHKKEKKNGKKDEKPKINELAVCSIFWYESGEKLSQRPVQFE